MYVTLYRADMHAIIKSIECDPANLEPIVPTLNVAFKFCSISRYLVVYFILCQNKT